MQCFPVLVQNKKSIYSIIAGGGEGVRGREGGGGPHSAGAAAADQPHPHPGGRHRGLGQVRGPGQREPPAQLRSGGVSDGEVRDQFTVECGVTWSGECLHKCDCFLLAPPSTLIFTSYFPSTKLNVSQASEPSPG